MVQARFQFHGELKGFLPAGKRGNVILYPLAGPVSVKHAIEASGIPHTEVSLILANGISVDFSYLLQPDDDIRVFPFTDEIQVVAAQPLRPPLPHPRRFILDGHLGRLATYLRLLGFDTLYQNDYDDEELAEISGNEGRLLLTRDRRLLMRKVVDFGFCLRTTDPRQQLAAVLERYDLNKEIRPWHRCLRCNGRLRPVAKEAVLDRLEPKTKRYYHEFRICMACDQIYWKGSHYQPLQQLINEIR